MSKDTWDKLDRSLPPITLPWQFDTTSVWHTILKGAFALNGVLIVGIAVKLISGKWLEAGGVSLIGIVVAGFTVILYRFQRGSRGTVFADHVVALSNAVAGIPLPGARGEYSIERFRAVRVEYWSGRPSTDPNMGKAHEDIWLVGKPGTPDIVIAQTDEGAGGQVGRQFGALLRLPVEETGKPIVIHLGGGSNA